MYRYAYIYQNCLTCVRVTFYASIFCHVALLLHFSSYYHHAHLFCRYYYIHNLVPGSLSPYNFLHYVYYLYIVIINPHHIITLTHARPKIVWLMVFLLFTNSIFFSHTHGKKTHAGIKPSFLFIMSIFSTKQICQEYQFTGCISQKCAEQADMQYY